MSKEIVVKDAHGDNHAIDLSLNTYKEAEAAGLSVPQYLATQYPTNAEKHGTAFEQVLEQAGVFVVGSKEDGISSTRMSDMLNPREANAVTRDGTPVSRLLAPAVVLSAMENRLRAGVQGAEATASAFDSMIAYDDSVASDRFERLVFDFKEAGNAKEAPVAQLAMPPVMGVITVSDTNRRIPSWGIGLEISDQAARAMTVDLLGMTLARSAAVRRERRAESYVLALLNGDIDTGDAALSAISGKVVSAASLDSGATTGISHQAWIKWLSANPTKRVIDTVVTDLAGAFAIEQRAGRPTANDNFNDTDQRFNTTFDVLNSQWPSRVKIFITNNPAWPAKTVMGFDSRWGVHRVRSLTAKYEAVEQFVLKRSTAMRFDDGEVVYRLFDEAFEVLTYA